MKHIYLLAIALVLGGCSRKSGDAPPNANETKAPSKLAAAAGQSDKPPASSSELPDFSAQDSLSPDQWELFIANGIPVSRDAAAMERSRLGLSLSTTVKAGRTDFDYRRPIAGDFVLSVDINVRPDSNRPLPTRERATRTWFQIHAADNRTQHVAAPAYQGPDGVSRLVVVRRGDQVICLSNNKQRAARKLAGAVQFGLWINGEGHVDVRSVKLEEVTPDVAQFPQLESSSQSGSVAANPGVPPGFAGGPPGFGGAPPGMQAGFGGAPPGAQGGFGSAPGSSGFGGAQPNAGFAAGPNSGAMASGATFGSTAPIIQFKEWEIPSQFFPDQVRGQIASSVNFTYNGKSRIIRVNRHLNGPPFPLQYAKRLVGDFTIDIPLVVYGAYAQRRGEVGVAVVPEDFSGQMRPTSLPPKEGANREYIVSFERSGRKIITKIDDKTVMEREIPGAVRLHLAVAGQVEFAIKPLGFDRNKPAEVARVEPEPEPEEPTVSEPVSPDAISQPVTTYPLPAPVEKVVVAGGGKYLLLHFPTISKLGLFNVELGKITHAITLRGNPKIAAGAEHAVVLSEKNGMIARLRLSDLKLDARGQLPNWNNIVDMTMGSASAGPIFLVEKHDSQFVPQLVDMYTLARIKTKTKANFAADWTQAAPIRASADGTILSVSGNPARVIGGGTQLREHKQFGINVLLPNALADAVFTDQGVYDRKLKRIESIAQSKPATPAATGPFYLTVGVTSPSAEAEPTGAVALHTIPQGNRLVEFNDLKVATNPTNFNSGKLRLDERLVFHSQSGTIVVVDPANDKLHIKRIDMAKLFNAIEPPDVLVTSHPPAVALRGEVYEYQVEALSGGDEVEYKFLFMPKGMDVSPTGLVTWRVPEDWATVQPVILGLRKSEGEFIRHEFTVQIRHASELTAGEIAVTSPAEPKAPPAKTASNPVRGEKPDDPEPPRTSSATAASGYGAAEVASDAPSKYLDPELLGFDIPAGKVTLPEKQSVTTNNEDGEGVVAKVYADIGANRIVMLPNGKLVARTRDESPLTERAFRPASRKDITDQLKARFPGFATKATRHFNYVYNTTPNFFTGTSRILETLLPGLRKFAGQQGIKTHDPEVPLIVIMFHSQRQFSLYSKMPDGVLAYYDVVTNEIVMHEESPFLKSDPELAFKDTIATIAHEGAHQILYNIGVQKRLSMWPMWLSEGLAEYLSPTSFGKDLRWKGPGATHDMRMLDLELYFKSRGLETTDETMIKYSVGAYGLSSSGYASAWAITHYLATNEKEAFAAHLREVSEREPFERPGDLLESGIIPQNLKLFEKHFGSDLAEMERKLIEHLKKLPYDDPYAELPHFVAMIEWKADGKTKREANVFHLPSMATKWLEDKRKVLSAEGVPRATVAVRDYANRPIAEREVQRFLLRR